MKSTLALVLIAVSGLSFATTAFAKVAAAPVLQLTCASSTAIPDAELMFVAGDLQAVLVGTKALWSNDVSKFDRSALTDVTALVSGSQFLKTLVIATGAKPETFTKVEIVAITAKSNATAPMATMDRQIEILGDDAAGIAYVVLTDAKGDQVTSSVMIGWAGMFVGCN